MPDNEIDICYHIFRGNLAGCPLWLAYGSGAYLYPTMALLYSGQVSCLCILLLQTNLKRHREARERKACALGVLKIDELFCLR